MGRPRKGEEHPRPEFAKRIRTMVAVGISHADIARVLKMSTDTLHKHYKDDLDVGAAAAHEVVGGKIFSAAANGEPWAASLWAARRMGWKETSAQEISGGLSISVNTGVGDAEG